MRLISPNGAAPCLPDSAISRTAPQPTARPSKPRDQEVDVRRAQRLHVEDVVVLGGIQLAEVAVEPVQQRDNFGLVGPFLLDVDRARHQTRKDSPQPQRSFSRGLWNLNPSLSPSRTKSSSVPSR